MVLKGLRRGETTGNTLLDRQLQKWANRTSLSSWGDVLAAKGLPSIPVSPIASQLFGEQLGPAIWGRFSQIIAVATCSKRINKYTLNLSRAVTETFLASNITKLAMKTRGVWGVA